MKKTAAFLGFCLICASLFAATAELKNVGAYAVDDVVLENHFLKIQVNPRKGARIVSFINKTTGSEHAEWVVAGGNEDGGLLRDLAPSVPHPGEFKDSPFKFEIIEPGPERAVVAFQYEGQATSTKGLIFSKKLTLREDALLLEVDLRIENRGYATQTIDWRVHNSLKPAGAWELGNDFCYLPTTEGGIELSQYIDPAKKGGNRMVENFIAGWMAIVDQKKAEGLVSMACYDQLSKELFWIDKTGVTLEQFFSPVTLKPGDTWQSKLGFGLFTGLKKIDYASFDGVFQFDASSSALKIFPFQKADLAISVAGKPGVEGKAEAISALTVALVPGRTAEIKIPLPEKKPELLCFDLKSGEESGAFPVLLNQSPAGKLALSAPPKNPPPIINKPVEKLKVAEQKTNLAGVKSIKILQLSTFQFETSQDGNYSRLEECRLPLRAREMMQYYLKDAAGVVVDNAFENMLAEYLPQLYQYDVLVLNDVRAEIIAPYVDDILKYVEKGHGLIVLGGVAAFGGRETSRWDKSLKKSVDSKYGDYKSLQKLLPIEILNTPDWLDQTRYPEGKKGVYGGIGEYTEFPCPECGKTIRYYNGGLPLMNDLGWLNDNKTLAAVSSGHPAIAGIPLDTLSPDYHKVAAKQGADVVAAVGKDPVIVTRPCGKGRIAAVMISDCRRLYFWNYTGRLFSQLAEWCAGRPRDEWIESVKIENEKIKIAFRNGTKEKRKIPLKIQVIGPDFKKYLDTSVEASAPANASGEVVLELAMASLPLNGKYLAAVNMPGHQGEAYFQINRQQPVQVTLKHYHKQSFCRGEPIQPEIKASPLESAVKINAELVDASGQTVAEQKNSAAQSFKMPTDNLACGDYKLVVTAVDADGKTMGAGVMDLSVIPEAGPVDFPVMTYGMLGISSATYSQLAGVEYLLDKASLMYVAKIGEKHPHSFALIDKGARLGARFVVDCNRATMYGPSGWNSAKDSQRSPDKLAWTSEFLRKQFSGFEKISGIWGMYVDDEGNTRSMSDYDRTEFKRIYGLDMPDKPVTLKEKMALGDYFLKSADLVYKANADFISENHKSWKTVFIKSVAGNRGHLSGIDIEENFKTADAVMPDIYPGSLFDIGMDFFYMNLTRCAARRIGKPACFFMQSVYGDTKIKAMQYWLLLGSGLEGYGWYSIAGVYSGDYDVLAPLDRFAVDYGCLFGAWDKPDSKIAVLYADAMLCQEDVKPFKDNLINLSEELYKLDLYPDFIREKNIRDKSADNYDVLILAGIKELAPEVLQDLEQFAKKRVLMVDDKTEINIPGAIKLDYKELRKKITPKIETPDMKIFAEPLKAGEMDYAVVYNHNISPAQAEIIINDADDIGAVYDIRAHREIKANKNNHAMVFADNIPGNAGAVYALFNAPPKKISIVSPEAGALIKPGETAQVRVKIESAARGKTPVRIDVVKPDGTKSSYSCRKNAENGELTVALFFGINEQKGSWQITAEDMITGLQSSREVQIK